MYVVHVIKLFASLQVVWNQTLNIFELCLCSDKTTQVRCIVHQKQYKYISKDI